MPQRLTSSARVRQLEESGEAAMKASLAKGILHGYEVEYTHFAIDGRSPAAREPIRVKADFVANNLDPVPLPSTAPHEFCFMALFDDYV
jgi:hypothetical protein